MSEINIIKKKIRDIDFNFIKYIRDETKAFANKVIFISFITILLCLEIIKIEELELDGIKINIKPYAVVSLLCLINFYYFLQFLNSIKIDNLVTKLPNAITEIFELIEELRTQKLQKIDALGIEMQNAIKNNKIDLETQDFFRLKQESIKADEYLEISENWIKTSNKFLKHHNRNMALNYYFPILFFTLAIISFLYSLY